VRGFALLGILIMNLPLFYAPVFGDQIGAAADQPWWNQVALAIRDSLISGKFNGLFSMLFAVGFTLQLERLHERDPLHADAIYLRRLFWLLIFGLLHGFLFWVGDVLHSYAILGLLLILVLNRLSDHAIVSLIIATLLYRPLSTLLAAAMVSSESTAHVNSTAANVDLAMEQLNAAQETAAHGTFWQALQQNIRTFYTFYAGPWYSMHFGRLISYVTTMLIGLLLGRQRFFQNAQACLPLLRRLQWPLLGAGILTGAAFAVWNATVEDRAASTVWKALGTACYSISRLCILGFYVAVIVRGMHSERWRGRLRPLAIAGRMPLTNYLMQTLICTSLFMGWGFGLWGRSNPALDLLIAGCIFFLIQVPLSKLWLKHFAMGPMEYLWRTLTYGRRPQ
jgi:uncharacterized protein